MRSFIHVLTLLLIMRTTLKATIYDSLPHGEGWRVIFRSVQVMFSFVLILQAIKSLPLVESALVVNLAPLFVAVLGYFILGDKL